jgi:uncharacterized protein DUF6754
MTDPVGLGLVLLSGALLLLLSWTRRKQAPKLRFIAAFTRLYRAIGLSVEDGSRLLIGLGGSSLLTKNGGAALAGLGLLREISQKTSVSDQPPVAVSGESSLALLSQDTLQAGYRAAGAAEYYQAGSGRLTGMSPFSAAAGTMPLIGNEQVSAAALIGHYGAEAALIAEAAERGSALLIGATDDPTGQAVLFASASESLIGEELFASAAYLGGDAAHAASLTIQDVLRWLIILALLGGAALRVLGII